MAESGFGRTITRLQHALGESLSAADAVTDTGDWVATAIPGERAVMLSPGQGRAAAVLVPDGYGGKTDEVRIELPKTGAMTHQRKIICLQLDWLDLPADPADPTQPGMVSFVVLDAGDFAALPPRPTDFTTVQGFTRNAGVQYHVPLWSAGVQAGNSTVTLTDLRVTGGGGIDATTRMLQLVSRHLVAASGGPIASRDALYGVPASESQRLALQGAEWFHTPTGNVERYYATRTTSNPGGRPTPGWYSVGKPNYGELETTVQSMSSIVALHANDRGWTGISAPNGSSWQVESSAKIRREGRTIELLSAMWNGVAGTRAFQAPSWAVTGDQQRVPVSDGDGGLNWVDVFTSGAISPLRAAGVHGRSIVRWTV